MKKYKLIKKYPGSPELGYISKPKDTPKHDLDTALHYWDHIWFDPSKYPEFWEEIKEPEYEILRELGGWIDKFAGLSQEKKILSIKRLSDNEIFTIGDKVTCAFDHYKMIRTIVNFKIIHDKHIEVTLDNGHTSISDILDLQKASQPLFVTEDGVDKYEGDSYYYIVTADISSVLVNKWIVMCHTVDWDNPKKVPLGAIQFHNLTLAQEYIDLNKPRYSKQEMLDFGEFCRRKDHLKIIDLLNLFGKKWK